MQERANARLKRRPGRAAKAKITRGNIAPAYEVPTSNPLKRIGRNLPAMFNDRFWNDAKAGNNPFAYKQVKR
jgi:hypothetical protein